MPTHRVSNMPAAGHSGQFRTANRSASQTRTCCLITCSRQLPSVTCATGRMHDTCYNAFHPQLELRIPLSFDTGVSVEPGRRWFISHAQSFHLQMVDDMQAASGDHSSCCADELSTCQAAHCRMHLPSIWQVRNIPVRHRGQYPLPAAPRKPADDISFVQFKTSSGSLPPDQCCGRHRGLPPALNAGPPAASAARAR
jgi:hypothetical protein